MGGKFERVAVVDIGSNSVRLVIYDGLKRNPTSIFNEKVLCGLGRGINATGRLNEQGRARALATLTRFSGLIESSAVTRVLSVATAAIREAADGPEFVVAAERALGWEIDVLSGVEEAELAAQGVLSAIPRANGLMGDLGGGSLELAELRGAEAGRVATLPLGSLRLMNGDGAKPDHKKIDRILGQVSWLGSTDVDALYAVGGSWRIIGRIHMARADHPMKVLHQYSISGDEARDFAKTIERTPIAKLAELPGVRRKRVDTLPSAAAVLRRLLALIKPSQVVFSSHGLREGLLYRELESRVRREDPLLESCREAGAEYGRYRDGEGVLMAWLAPLFAAGAGGDEAGNRERIRLACCLLSDIGWRWQSEYRAEEALLWIMRAPFVGLDHLQRAEIAVTLFHRYGGRGNSKPANLAASMLTPEQRLRARITGVALRLAHRMTAGVLARLEGTRLVPEKGVLALHLGPARANLEGEVMAKRLAGLARLLEMDSTVVVDG